MIGNSVLVLIVLNSVQINVSAVKDKLYLLALLPIEKGNVRIKKVNEAGAAVALKRIWKERIINPDDYEVQVDFLNDACDGTKSLEAVLAEFFKKSEDVRAL